MWSLWPWVQTMATTLRSPTASTMGWCSWAASTTSTSSSSPTSQMLLSTSKSSPSIENVPLVITRSTLRLMPPAPPSSVPLRDPVRVDPQLRSAPLPHGSKDDHRSEHLAPFHLVERLLDLVEVDGLADEPAQVDAALQ